MKLNAVLVFLILTATFVILLTSLLSGKSVLRPKASALSSAVTHNRVLLDPSRPLYLSAPSRPVVAELTTDYPGNEISYITQNGDLYVYSSQLVYIIGVPRVIDATVSAGLDLLTSISTRDGLSSLSLMTDKKAVTYKFDTGSRGLLSATLTITPTPVLLPDDPVIYNTLNPTDQLPSALFTRASRVFNELVVISSVDKNNPRDRLRVTTEFLKK